MTHSRFTSALSHAAGHPMALLAPMSTIVIWAASGPLLHFSDAWQLTISTGATIVAFLKVFVIQSSQNRDARALRIKPNELIRINSGARNSLLNLEEKPEQELAKIQKTFSALAEKAGEVRAEKKEHKKRARPAKAAGKARSGKAQAQ